MENNDLGNWIPVSEILPSVGTIVLISIILADGGRVCGLGCLNESNGWQIVYAPHNLMVAGVNAWMPSPSAYKEDIPGG